MATVAEKRQAVMERVTILTSEARDLVEGLKQELEEIRDNLEERFSETERYSMVSDACDKLDEYFEHLDEVSSGAEDIDFNW